MSVEEGQRLISLGEFRALDVREPTDYANGHVPGAVNVPRGQLEVVADTAPPVRNPVLQDRTQKIVCYCGGGTRSLLAAKTLKEMGFENVVSMAGGFRSWSESGLPIDE